MSAVVQNKPERDPRVEAAISHWAPRFVANGVPLRASISRAPPCAITSASSFS